MRIDPALTAIMCIIDPLWEKFKREDGSMVVQLDKALYGCIESSKLWYDHLRATLMSMGYTVSKIDPCVFFKTQDGKQCTIGTHVDDLFIASQCQSMGKEVLDKLKEVYETISVHDGDVHNYLGMTFDFTVKGKVTVGMEGYVQDVLSTYRVTKVAKTPATTHLYEIDEKSPKLTARESEEFHSATAKLLYLSLRTRPDILVAVSFLTTRVKEPTAQDKGKLFRVLEYLNGTRDLSLTIEPDKEICIIAAIDASHGVHPDGKGHTGGTYSLGKGAIMSVSGKQKIVSKSSAESELIAVSDFISNVIRAREFLIELGYQIGPAKILQDNQSTIRLMHHGRPASERTRHIAIRYFFVTDRIEAKEVEVQYCPTEMLTADILTKPLVGMKFYQHRHDLLHLPGTFDRRGVLEFGN
jgi:hypothetical protein